VGVRREALWIRQRSRGERVDEHAEKKFEEQGDPPGVAKSTLRKSGAHLNAIGGVADVACGARDNL
jgi:hypothetical protein